jgi:hypothetical protein
MNAMKKKPSKRKPIAKAKTKRKPRLDFAQNALRVVEEAIGGKLMSDHKAQKGNN